MKKNFFMIGLIAFTFTGLFIACEKEKTEPVIIETDLSINNSEHKTFEELRNVLDNLPSDADKERELRRLMAKYENESDRGDCFSDAWDYGTTEAAAFFEFVGDDNPSPFAQSYVEWYFMNEYYEEHCSDEGAVIIG